MGDLSEESKRAERENLEEDELTVFDMLSRDKKISDKEKAEVKVAARELLDRLKNNEFKVDRWTEKIQTASAVKKVIEDYLFKGLPSPSYDEDIQVKSEILFNDLKFSKETLCGILKNCRNKKCYNYTNKKSSLCAIQNLLI